MDDISSLELADGTAFSHIAAPPGARERQSVFSRKKSAPSGLARQLRAIATPLLGAALFVCVSVALVLLALLTPWRWMRPWKKKDPADSLPDWM
jgi:hypothetical protein